MFINLSLKRSMDEILFLGMTDVSRTDLSLVLQL